MDFRIADTFTGQPRAAHRRGAEGRQNDRLRPADESGAARPAVPRIDKSKDHNFWSVRVSGDLRLIVHRTGRKPAALLRRSSRRRLRLGRAPQARNPSQDRRRPARRECARPCRKSSSPSTSKSRARHHRSPPLFAAHPGSELLGYGVPPEWLDDVRTARRRHATRPRRPPAGRSRRGAARTRHRRQAANRSRSPPSRPTRSRIPTPSAASASCATSRNWSARSITPWDKWTVFLHPAQRQLVERDYNGPARVAGSAGTGKTIVALHRAVHPARKHPDARILLTTFSDTLANALQAKLQRLLGNEPRLAERIDVYSMPAVGKRLYRGCLQRQTPADRKHRNHPRSHRRSRRAVPAHKFTRRFLFTEWSEIVDAWQLETWEMVTRFQP